jgi:phage gp36-like protein
MSLYIDLAYMQNFMGANPLSASLSYNGTLATMTGSKFDQYASGACSQIDAFLYPTYAVPLSSAPPLVKQFAAAIMKRDLLRHASMEVPEQLDREIRANEGYLVAIHNGEINVPGISKDTAGNTAGGAAFSDRSSGSVYEGAFGPDQLKGTFY